MNNTLNRFTAPYLMLNAVVMSGWNLMTHNFLYLKYLSQPGLFHVFGEFLFSENILENNITKGVLNLFNIPLNQFR